MEHRSRYRNPVLLIRQSYKGSFLGTDHSDLIPFRLFKLGTVEAPDEAAAMEKASVEFKVAAKRLMAIRR